jgi:gamma-glutamyl-gamma-aminobutyrate hydrolase
MDIILTKPRIGVVMCSNRIGLHPAQTLQEKYLNAIIAAGGVPIALPHRVAEQPEMLLSVLGCLQGILLPGSPSNLQPHLYGQNGDEPDADPSRDTLSIALIEQAILNNIPLFAICRGLQEMTVATGGTLYRKLHQQTDFLEHREDKEASLEQQYAPSHEIVVVQGGLLAKLAPDSPKFWVNSLHGQGIRTLGSVLQIEAKAPDGLIEAVSVRGHPFALGVQWHPEWNSEDYELSRCLFHGFIAACRDYANHSHAK